MSEDQPTDTGAEDKTDNAIADAEAARNLVEDVQTEQKQDDEREEVIKEVLDKLQWLLPARDEIAQIVLDTIPPEFHNSPVLEDDDASIDPCLKMGMQENGPHVVYLGQVTPSRSGKSKYMVLSLTDDDLLIDWDWPRFRA